MITTERRKWPPLHRFRDPGDREEAKNNLHLSIKGGNFTPFLGAGASSLRPARVEKDSPWVDVERKFATLKPLVTKQEPTALKFLESLAKDYRIEMKDDVPLNEGVTPMLEFQAKIAQLASALTDIFADNMSKVRRPVIEIEDYSIDLSSKDQLKASLPLFESLNAARVLASSSLASTRRDDIPSFEGLAIYRRLRVLVCSLLDAKCWASLDALVKKNEELPNPFGENSLSLNALFEKFERTRAYENDYRIRLRLDLIKWLTDLLWYTFSYDVPAYPTVSELTFVFSTILDVGEPPREVKLAESAEAWMDEAELSGRLKKWLLYVQNTSRKPFTEFHERVAKALIREYDNHPILSRKQTGRPEPSSDELLKSISYPLPIAFTTNYDRCLELAIIKANREYHVIYPVTQLQNGHGRRWSIKWRVCHGIPNANPDQQENPLGDLALDEETPRLVIPGMESAEEKRARSKPIDIRGPIIIKLHGSPLHPIDDTREQHFLVLSESSYLKTMLSLPLTPGYGYPVLFDHEMANQYRDLWFLGYSLRDWNIRLGLYRQAYENLSSGGNFRATVNRRHDNLRSAVLGTLGVNMYLGELAEFGEIIGEAM